MGNWIDYVKNRKAIKVLLIPEMNNVKYKFNNKVAVVTGAGSGIGYDVARILYNSGAKVILLGRSKNVKDKARLLNKSFERIEYYILDLSKDEKVKKIFKKIYQKNKKIDILINSAGVTGGGKIETINTLSGIIFIETMVHLLF